MQRPRDETAADEVRRATAARPRIVGRCSRRCGLLAAFEFAGEAEVEAGEVGEDGECGFALLAAATSLRIARRSEGDV